MEVGSARERILIALMIHVFGDAVIDTKLPIAEAEIDVIVQNTPISIKTVSGRRIGGVKLIWTVDREQALAFAAEYSPRADMFLAHINWGGEGGLLYFPRHLQADLLRQMGRNQYIKLPKPGTNPRGVEISARAIRELANQPQSLRIPILWERQSAEYDPYDRWLKMWEED